MSIRKNRLSFIFCLSFFLFPFTFFLSPSPVHALFDSQEKQRRIGLETQAAKLQEELKTVTLDRDNLLKQAKNIQTEKEELVKKVEEIKSLSSGAAIEAESLKKENEILKSEVAKMKAARQKDRELYREERQALEKKIADQEARANSLALMMKEYPVERIQMILEDRNRLEQETKQMAQRIFEHQKRLEEMRKQLTPLELDREELHRLQAENRELRKRTQYVSKLESRQRQLVKENAEYREQVEVLKAKLKDAVPGIAKSSRISQKMMRENADMHYNLGTIFLHNKQYRESLREYERVLELRPNDPETHYNLGILYDDYVKDRDKALYHFQKYLAIHPKAPDAKKVETYILALELEQKVR